MSAANRRRRAWFGVSSAVAVALLAWVLWPKPDSSQLVAPTSTPRRIGVPESKPRAERRRDVAAPAEVDAPPSRPVVAAEPSKRTDEPTFPFEVTVLRADGTPAVGAKVVLVGDDDHGEWTAELARAAADEKGLASMRVPESNVRIAAWLGPESAATAEFFAVKTRHEASVRLGPSIVARGRVLRGDSEPVAGADVELESRPWFGSDPGLSMHATSDETGRFEFPAIPRAGIDPLNPPYASASTKDQASGTAEVDLDRVEADLVIHLVEPFTVRGRFLDAGGKPVAAELRAYGPGSYHAATDADGRVALRVPAGGAFSFLAFRKTSRAVTSDVDDGNPVVEMWSVPRLLGTRASDATGDVQLGDVVLVPGRPVKGRAVDGGARAVPGARASLLLGDRPVGSVVAGADGRFEFPEVGDEPHVVHVSDPRAITEGNVGTADVENVRGGDPELRVVLTNNRLFVLLTFLSDGDRKPIKAGDVAVKAFRHGEKDECAGHHVYGDVECMESDSVELPEPGSYDVEITVGGYEPQRFEAVQVLRGRPTSLDVLLRKKPG